MNYGSNSDCYSSQIQFVEALDVIVCSTGWLIEKGLPSMKSNK